MVGSECEGGLGEGSTFQLVRGPQKLSFRALSSRRSSLTQIFVESCVDFEVAHLSAFMVWRLPYPEVPTLNRSVPVSSKACTAKDLGLVRPKLGCFSCSLADPPPDFCHLVKVPLFFQ